MASRLTELLDRIRPAGAPGAPSDLVTRRRQSVTDEIADVADVLERFDDEVDLVLADARARAERIRTDAERRAGEIRADLPGRVAVAESAQFDETPHSDAEVDRAAAESAAQIDRLRERAGRRMPDLVERAMAVIWELAATTEPERPGPP